MIFFVVCVVGMTEDHNIDVVVYYDNLKAKTGFYLLCFGGRAQHRFFKLQHLVFDECALQQVPPRRVDDRCSLSLPALSLALFSLTRPIEQ